MTYQPLVPLSGYSGWLFLNRTMESQQSAFENSSTRARETDYFREKIGSIETAEQLVADRRLLNVALGAFGLEDDINNKYFIQKVLEDGTLDADALGNRLSDTRYYEFSKAFGFGDFETPNTVLSSFADDIVTQYNAQQFEIAVGEQNNDFRLALNFARNIVEIADKETSDNGKWYSVMGNEPLRSVFETALGLPSSFAALDLDQQLDQFREKTRALFGDSEVAQFSDPEKQDTLVRMFLVRSEIASSPASLSSASNALTLLTSAL